MYATPEQVRSLSELLRKYKDLTDDIISAYIAKAEARVNAYLSARYLVPLAEPVPKIINSIVVDMTGAFILDEKVSERMKDQTTFAEVLMKRAEQDLEKVVEKGLIDREPGVVLAAPARTKTGPQMATTTPEKSPIEDVLAQW
ncbi:phage protein Gp36 family protein [Desulfofundulus thermosubterraneus]|uniref:Mu-like prophage protein gp36 n=1 Tax=Desulfofundulus thermosubterraneus DSM 16057 TaxID=1121432 RepID=A0A1M6KMB3_9FIRM|nr:phage protein Gp36 family protein [Desulfofundulus thermosubterraneus]SHJ60168.1 Protein of unknown function [Desulfofundulus thermosubterraneus DSM 16057]